MSVSAARSATACSWPRASRSTRSMSRRRAYWADKNGRYRRGREIRDKNADRAVALLCNLEGALQMKFVLTAIGAGVIATAMLSNPADARPKCVWEGHAWRCWNGHH